MTKALLIVDMVHDFVDENGALPVKGAIDLVDNINLLRDAAEKKGYAVIYANDAHDYDDKEFQTWPRHSVSGTYGAKIIEDLTPKYKNDIIIEKQDLSFLTNKYANQILKERGIRELYVTGVATEYCVKNGALDAIRLGYAVNLVTDAIAGVGEIKLPDGNVVPGTTDAIPRAYSEMTTAGIRPMKTINAL